MSDGINDGYEYGYSLAKKFADEFQRELQRQPVPSGTQDEREREIREREDEINAVDEHDCNAEEFVGCTACVRANQLKYNREIHAGSDIQHLLSLLDAERKRTAAVTVLLRAKCSEAEWAALPKDLQDVVPQRCAPCSDKWHDSPVEGSAEADASYDFFGVEGSALSQQEREDVTNPVCDPSKSALRGKGESNG